MKLAICSGALVWALVAAPERAAACSCGTMSLKDARDAYKRASVAFRGRIVQFTAKGEKDWMQVTFAVERWWKGSGRPLLTAFDSAGAMCGVKLTPGERYRVLTNGEEDGALDSLHACTGTTPIFDAELLRKFPDAMLKVLPAGKPPDGTPGWAKLVPTAVVAERALPPATVAVLLEPVLKHGEFGMIAGDQPKEATRVSGAVIDGARARISFSVPNYREKHEVWYGLAELQRGERWRLKTLTMAKECLPQGPPPSSLLDKLRAWVQDPPCG